VKTAGGDMKIKWLSHLSVYSCCCQLCLTAVI